MQLKWLRQWLKWHPAESYSYTSNICVNLTLNNKLRSILFVLYSRYNCGLFINSLEKQDGGVLEVAHTPHFSNPVPESLVDTLYKNKLHLVIFSFLLKDRVVCFIFSVKHISGILIWYVLPIVKKNHLVLCFEEELEICTLGLTLLCLVEHL